MTETTDTKQIFTEREVADREAAARRRGYLIGGSIAGLVVALLAPLTWHWVDGNVYLRDDRGVGERFRTQMHLDGYGCERVAEVLYAHGVRPIEGYTRNDDGWAPRSEKAFYAGCTGTDAYFGGGGGD
jgi:hypothetical protein